MQPQQRGGGNRPALMHVALLLMLVTAGAGAQSNAGEQASAEPAVDASEIEVREVLVRMNRPDEVFHKAATSVTLWVRDGAGEFETLLRHESDITAFQDSSGTDLIAGHSRQIEAWDERVETLRKEGRFVHMGRSRELLSADALESDEGAEGFYLTVESWAIPATDAETLRLAGNLSYVVATDEQRQRVFEEINLADRKIVRIGEWGIRPTDFNTQDGTRRFALSTTLPIEQFEIRSTDGEELGGIVFRLNGRPMVEIPTGVFEQTVHLTVTYRAPLRRTVSFDRQVDVGL